MRPVIFGEVLFDVFQEAAVLGGAPFNVAWHLQGLNLPTLFISRIGKDDLGERIKQRMMNWGMDIAGLQEDSTYPTGQVQVHKSGPEHRFETQPDQAYDYIDTKKALTSLGQDPLLLYHGSLATRTPPSKTALTALKRQLACPVFIDINLRAPWWKKDHCLALIKKANWVKMNDEELDALAPSGQTHENRARTLMERMKVQNFILTRAQKGAILFTQNKTYNCSPPKENRDTLEIVDTVGAGDAFAAVVILGLIQNWPSQHILERAQNFALQICAQRGAISSDRNIYQKTLETWA